MKIFTFLLVATCMNFASAKYSNVTVQALATLKNYTSAASESVTTQGDIFTGVQVSAAASYTSAYEILYAGVLNSMYWSPIGLPYFLANAAISALGNLLSAASVSASVAANILLMQANFSASVAADLSAFRGYVTVYNVSAACWNESKPQLKAVFEKAHDNAVDVTNVYCASINASVQAYKQKTVADLASIQLNASASCNWSNLFFSCSAYVSFLSQVFFQLIINILNFSSGIRTILTSPEKSQQPEIS